MAIKPSQYKILQPFQAWVQQTLPAIYDDSLSYTDLLAKLLYYINTLAENNTTLSNDVTNAINYINNYLGSDDFLDQVRNKLDDMASDGTLSRLIQPLFDEYKTEIDTIVAEQNKKINYLSTYVTPEMFGAVGDGVADDTEALRSAIAKSNELNIELKLYKRYKISQNIDLPKKIGVIGCSSPKPTIISNNKSTIYIRGGGDNLFNGKIENVKFDYVQLVFGENTNDYGNQYIMRDCEFAGNSDVEFNSITLQNNCWNMNFDNVIHRNVGVAFLLNFIGKINSGACIKFNNCTATDGACGFKAKGACVDGGDIWFVNCNFEHNDYGYYFDDNTAGLYGFVVNTHFESNRICGCYSGSAIISFDGGWGFYDPSISSFDSMFYAKNAEIFIQNMRLNSGHQKYYHTEGTGIIHIGDNVLAPSESYYNNGGKGTNRYILTGYHKVKKQYTLTNEKTNSLDTQTARNKIKITGSINVLGGQASTNDIVFINEGDGAPRVLNIPISDITKNVGGNINFEININDNNIFAIFNDIAGQQTTVKTATLNINKDIPQSYYFKDVDQNKRINVTYIIGN